MLSATTMTAGKKELKDRITRIAENRRTVGVALLAVVAAAALVCALTFTGAKPSVRSLTGEELSGYALAFNSADCWQDSAGNDCGLRPVQFLTSVYDQPRSIDMYQLFYNGVSPEQAVSDAERQEVTDHLLQRQRSGGGSHQNHRRAGGRRSDPVDGTDAGGD